jgi:hypothetical protein
LLYENLESYSFSTSPRVETEDNSTVNFGMARRKAVIFGSVRDDAGKALDGVVVRLAGPGGEKRIPSSESGSWVANALEPGDYVVSLDLDTLPPSYAVAVKPQTITVNINDPGRVSFVVRALRSVGGRILCGGGLANLSAGKARVKAGSAAAAVENGRFRIRDMASGPQQIVLQLEGFEAVRKVDLPAGPADLNGIDFEICVAAR